MPRPSPASLARLAFHSPCHQRHVAIIISGGRILAWATNTRQRHAEIRAIAKVPPLTLRGCTLLSLRLTPAGALGTSAPCPVCWEAINAGGLASVQFYSARSRSFETIYTRTCY